MKLERAPIMAPIKFTAVNLTHEAREVLRLRAVTVSAAIGRRVSMSDALLVIDLLASQHADEIATFANRILSAKGDDPE
jgi:hypothetical protein